MLYLHDRFNKWKMYENPKKEINSLINSIVMFDGIAQKFSGIYWTFRSDCPIVCLIMILTKSIIDRLN